MFNFFYEQLCSSISNCRYMILSDIEIDKFGSSNTTTNCAMYIIYGQKKKNKSQTHISISLYHVAGT